MEARFLYKVKSKALNDKKAVYFSKPCLVAYYDYNYDVITKAKRIKYFIEPKANMYPIDLNTYFHSYVRRNQVMYAINLELVLKYDMSSAAESNDVENIKTKVFTKRGALVHLMESFYNRRITDFQIRVSRYNDNLYMVKEETDESSAEIKKQHSHHALLGKMLFADSPGCASKMDEPCDENIMLLCIHRSNFGKYDMIYSGEVQGIIDDEIITDFDDLDMLNEHRFAFSKQMWKKLKNNDYKLLKYWLQAYLANVKDIYFGYKSEDGIIDEPIEHVLTKDLPKNRYWKPATCTGFLYEFLENVERVMCSVNSLHTVYVFHYNQNERCFTYEVFKGKTHKSFITEEYIEFCKDRFNN